MTTANASTDFDNAVADINNALVKIFTLMPERMKQKYKLDGGQVQLATGFAMLSAASQAFCARVDGAPLDGMELRRELQQLAAQWILKHTENTGDCVAW